ncbi:MAG TPA: ATP-binding protein [Hyphomicrobium sp.]|nr:ATP-binding protein [Hyphomicrobium sp.]
MRTLELLKRTPARLAAQFTAIFIVATLILFAAVFVGTTARLETDIRKRVEETITTLANLDQERGLEQLIPVVTSESSSVRDSDFVFELDSADGSFLAGNVRGVRYAPGWLRLKRSDIFLTIERGRPDDEFFALWRPLSKGRLLVGSSNREVRKMQAFLLQMLGFSVLLTIFVLALGAAYLARKAQRRIDAFATTLNRVSQGDLSARVPMTGHEDDIDQIGAQINRTVTQLQRLIANVNQASSDIAHDLKTPLGRVRQKLEITDRPNVTTTELKAAVDTALVDLDGISQTFDALLRITQIEAGARKARFVDLDLQSVLDDILEAFTAVAEDGGCYLSCTSRPDGRVMIRGDRELLVQLFANLIENSLRHCPQGTKISMSLERFSGANCLTVSDSGPGIPVEERENVFRRLYRIERARTTPGSGLGLSLVAAIAELHDARIELFDNNPGLRVALTFPDAAHR